MLIPTYSGASCATRWDGTTRTCVRLARPAEHAAEKELRWRLKLLAWNPTRWPWKTFDEDIATFRRRGSYTDAWSCGGSKRIRRGDRVFIIHLGREPRGIFASGVAASDTYLDRHWD